MTAPPTTSGTVAFSTVNKVGLALAVLLGVSDIVGAFSSTPEGEVGPPVGILLLDGVLGLVTVVGVLWALRSRSRGAVRIVAASRIVSAITALPAFFVDIPDWLRLLAGATVILTVVVVVMMLTPARRSELVLD
jgi:hypothetical protein